MTEDAEEQAWLCHDIGRCYMELGQYTEVLEYGGKALMEVTDSTDKHIQLSIKVLMAQAYGGSMDATGVQMRTPNGHSGSIGWLWAVGSRWGV